MHVYMYVSMYVCVCMYVCMDVCMYVSVCVCMFEPCSKNEIIRCEHRKLTFIKTTFQLHLENVIACLMEQFV
jgi:hypothetical protein